MTRPWGVHPGVAHQQAILARLAETSGRAAEAWLDLAGRAGVRGAAAARAFFKAQGLGMASAGALADLLEDGAVSAEAYLARCDGYVDAQYAGRKAALRPLFEALLARAQALGEDVRACPCQTRVPLYRTRVFAEIVPFAGRLDLGLALGDPAALAGPRLRATGGFEKRDRITVKLEVRSPEDLDADLEAWLRRAYAADA